MKTNTPHLPKTNSPDSDESARGKLPYAGDEQIEDGAESIEGLQTSNKTGKHSSVERFPAAGQEFGAAAGAKPVDSAVGNDADHNVSGRLAGPDTNQFRCSACGRFFNSQGELSAHEGECRLAKAATPSGRQSLEQEDSSPHPKNDAGK